MRMEDMMRAGNRFEVLGKVLQGILDMQEAADLLRVCKRHCRRLLRRSETAGLKGLLSQRVHPAWNRIGSSERDTILALRRERYRDYNLLHLGDVLCRNHGIERSREYYRKLFLSEGLYSAKLKRRSKKQAHRKRFEAPQAGLLIQRDTSIHLWVPGADKPWRLILDLDDHSRKITGAYFSMHDDVLSNMVVCWETVETHGLPVSYYTDNNPIFNPLNQKPLGMYQFFRRREKEQAGEVAESLTQFKRALKELGIGCIHATPYQPQGKGKIERIFRFMQDRLVREMVTAKVTTIAEGNKYLRKWVTWYNHHHVHSITKMIPNERYLRNNGFRELPKGTRLSEIFCLKYQRQVKADNTFQLNGITYQIPRNAHRIGYAKAQVEVRVYITGKMKIFYKGQSIADLRYKTNKNNPLEDILALQ